MAGFPLNVTLGPIIIGAFLAVFFFGVICMQTVYYLKRFPDDIFLVKFTVISLWVLQVAYTCFICQGAYAMAVGDFGSTFALLYAPIGLNLAVLMGSLTDHGVQAFFVARIYKATGALYLCIFLWTATLFLLGISLFLTIQEFEIDSIPIFGLRWKTILNVLFFGDASLDIVNACVLCFYLKLKSRSAFSQTTADVLNRLVIYTLETGLGTSLVALAAAISFRVAPNDYLWTMFFMALPGSFGSALLANVNNRTSTSQPNSAVSSDINNNVHGQTSIQFARSLVLSTEERSPSERAKSERDDPSHSIELNKISAPHGNFYAV
ncbi:hypothetical protein B0H16DRAFT_1613472 [Mycena metata]|uniref:DUF6534 domain-containing protein n=1 Tax=Mycena metata TaxID=1033252 RepID=A0AAD7MHI8_9AGAR|nr:hypothetical protein B0H16DRAFT_1613472 [Mycena metata]